VELVRGPQGDLVGKNAEAGLLDIHTIIPDSSRLIIASSATGSYDYWNGNALVSGPILPNTLFAKIEGAYLSRDGYLDNTFRDTHPDFQQRAFGRLQLRLTPTTDLEIDLSLEYHYIRDGVQRLIIGNPRDESSWGTGLLPKECLVAWSRNKQSHRQHNQHRHPGIVMAGGE